MRTRLNRQERRLVLVLLDHETDSAAGHCSCGFTCDPGSAYTLAVHVASHITDTTTPEEEN